MSKQILLGVVAVALGACSQATRVESGGDVSPSVIPVNSRVLPPGATVQVALDQSLSASKNNAGDTFTAHITDAVMSQDGSTVVPAGSTVEGRITAVQPSSDPTKAGLIRLNFDRMNVNGEAYPFRASVVQTEVPGGSNNGDLMKKAGIGAVAGGVLGAVLGGDVKDIVLGGAIGAAAGSLISMGTSNADARLPEGTRMTLRVNDRIAFRR